MNIATGFYFIVLSLFLWFLLFRAKYHYILFHELIFSVFMPNFVIILDSVYFYKYLIIKKKRKGPIMRYIIHWYPKRANYKLISLLIQIIFLVFLF